MSATADLLDFAAAAHVLPAPVCADAVRLLGDTLAVGAAGAEAPGAAAILATARTWGTGAEARLLGDAERLPAPSAAFVNGYRIHCLEWDAVHEPAVVHALSVVTAALGAALDRRGGGDATAALTALAVGVDIAAGLGIAADSPLAFFRPATAGLIGAALAVARVEHVPRDRLGDVLGLAYSQCAGTMQAHVEGSIALPFQIATAARAALVAVDLVRAGFTGPRDALEGPFGYFRLIDSGNLARYTGQLGQVWRIAQISTKPWPSGRASHGVLGALAAAGLEPSAVARIEARVPPLVGRLVGRPMLPGMSAAYARLCLPFLCALMLRDGVIDPACFTAAAFADPATADLAARVTVTCDDNADANALSPQALRITLTSGAVTDIAIPVTLGAPQAPLSRDQAAAKLALARRCAGTIADPRLFADPPAYFTDPCFTEPQ